MLVLGLGGAGCDSIYQKTQAPLPPEPCAQLKFRIDEAQRAEQLTGQYFTTLRDGLNQGRSEATIATDIDRVAAAVFEFERRVASVRDAAALCEGQTQLTSEIDRLQGRSKELLDQVQVMRRGGQFHHQPSTRRNSQRGRQTLIGPRPGRVFAG